MSQQAATIRASHDSAMWRVSALQNKIIDLNERGLFVEAEKLELERDEIRNLAAGYRRELARLEGKAK